MLTGQVVIRVVRVIRGSRCSCDAAAVAAFQETISSPHSSDFLVDTPLQAA